MNSPDRRRTEREHEVEPADIAVGEPLIEVVDDVVVGADELAVLGSAPAERLRGDITNGGVGMRLDPVVQSDVVPEGALDGVLDVGRFRQSTFGLHIFAGWTHVFSQASMKRDDLGIDASLSDDYGLPNVGGVLKYDYRFSDYVGFDVQAVGPFPVQPSYVTTLFHVGTGLSFYLK